jgi:hypothetical protein
MYIISNILKRLHCPRVILLFMLIMIVCFNSYGQENYQSFYSHSLVMNNTGMYVLGSWAVLNISMGAYGWAHSTGDRMYFNQMNMFWNIINLSIYFNNIQDENTSYRGNRIYR